MLLDEVEAARVAQRLAGRRVADGEQYYLKGSERASCIYLRMMTWYRTTESEIVGDNVGGGAAAVVVVAARIKAGCSWKPKTRNCHVSMREIHVILIVLQGKFSNMLGKKMQASAK